MTTATLERKKERFVEDSKEIILERLYRIMGRPIVFWNSIGKGKSLCLVYFSYWFKALLDKPIISVGTKMSFQPKFGKVTELTTPEFGEQLKIVTALSKVINNKMSASEVTHYIEKAKKELGFILYDCIVDIDEGRQWIWNRDSNTNKNKGFVEYLMLSRHLKLTTMMTFPDWRHMDKAAEQQIKWRCKVDSDQTDIDIPPTTIYCEFRGDYSWQFEIPARNYFKYFVSENIIAFSPNALNLSNFGV